MADVSTELAFAVPAEDAGFPQNDSPQEVGAMGDDVDFDLGGVEANDYADPAIGDGMDDIGYEEDLAVADAAATVPDSAEDDHSLPDEVSGTNADENKGVDVIDYGDIDLLTGHDGSSGNDAEGSDGKQQLEEEHQQQAPETVSDGIELDFELHGGENVALENAGSNVDETLQEDDFERAGSANGGRHEDVEEDDAEEEPKIEVEEDEDNAVDADADATTKQEEGSAGADMQMHSEMDDDGSEAADQTYENVDNDDDVEDPVEEDGEEQEVDDAGALSGSLDNGLGLLGELYPASSFDVTVTWGDQVCPLFKAPDVDDPDMFYLEDAEALNYPLSRFLRTVRSSIATWVNSSDEIYIRVDDLGLEFGETTTEALLNQVTFHNLLALYSTLSKNDDSAAPKGVHITLGTRPNCLFRLRDLVTGAGLGKGLSDFRKQAGSDTDNSSEDNSENEAGLSNLPPDVEEPRDKYNVLSENDGDASASEDEGGDTEMTGALDGIAADNAAGLEANAEGEEEEYEEDDEDEAEEVPAVELANEDTGFTAPTEAEVLAVVQEETDYVAFTNEEDGFDATSGAISVAPGASDGSVSKPETKHGHEPPNVGELLDEATAETNNHHDYLDVWGDVEPSGADIEGQGQDEDQEEVARSQPANGTDHEPQQDDSVQDALLNVGNDDADASGVLADKTALQPGEDKITADDLDIALDSSATATLDHDEIDYEDNHAAMGASDSGNDIPDPGADEIDWDDDIKNVASDATTPTLQTISGKRSRETDGSGDALLDDSPDPKRQRAENPSG